MSEMVPTGSKYTDDQRLAAATQYAIQGSLLKIEQSLGIPDSTVGEWKKQEWWVELVGTLRHEKAEEHRAKYVAIIDKAQDRVLEAIPNATAQQAMIIAGVGTDKVRTHDGMPTSYSGQSGDMKALAKQFEAMVKDKEIVVIKTIDPQPIDKTGDSQSITD